MLNHEKKVLINSFRIGFQERGRAHGFKFDVARHAGRVQQLLDGGRLAHLLLFQKDLECVGSVRASSLRP